MTELLIDTNVYSGFMLGQPAAVSALRSTAQVHLPLIVLGELLAGFAAGTREARNRDQLARFMASPRVHVLTPDEKTARAYAELFAELRRRGMPVPTNDLWIGALARQHRLPLLSFDAHFRSMPGVILAN
ncbi:MAG TPA: type II toxin-antitoxin system VapC family toxin [Burkholderiales bacterium]|nr:type II toxin-antitoxin system VapC family toxin [Burkholderiales bacterium]